MSGNGQTVRPARPVPDVMLERYLAGDLTLEQRAQIDAQCRASAEVRGRLEQLREERAAFYAAAPPPMFAHRVAVRLAHETGAPAKRRSWIWWGVFAGPSAAAVAAVLVAITYGDVAEYGSGLPAAMPAPAAIGEAKTSDHEETAGTGADAPATEAGREADTALEPTPAKPAPADRRPRAASRKGGSAQSERSRSAKEPVTAAAPARAARAARAKPHRPHAQPKAQPNARPKAQPKASSRARSRAHGAPPVAKKSARKMREPQRAEDLGDRLDRESPAGGSTRAAAPPPALPPESAASLDAGIAAGEDDLSGAREGDGEPVAADEPERVPAAYDDAPAAPSASRVGESRGGGARTRALEEKRDRAIASVLRGELEVRRGGRWRTVTSGQRLRPGDVVRASLAARVAGYAAVIGVRADGGRGVYLPAGGNAAVRVAAGKRNSSPALELRSEGNRANERVYFLFATSPFSIASALRGVRGQPARLPFTGEQHSVDLHIVADVPDAASAAPPP